MRFLAEIALYGQPSFREWKDVNVLVYRDLKDPSQFHIIFHGIGLRVRLIAGIDEVEKLVERMKEVSSRVE